MSTTPDGAIACRTILGVRANATTYGDAVATLIEWSREPVNRYVCVLSVHSVMESHDAPQLARIVNGSDLNTTDGMPLVWSLRMLGIPEAERVYGPELTARLLAEAAKQRVPVGFYGGSSPVALERLVTVAKERYPGLNVAYTGSPPVHPGTDRYRPATDDEDAAIRRAIVDSGTRILFVGLGCPKQEYWMDAHRSLPLVMVGVGAAFDFIAGLKRQAPRMMQRMGLEWLFRLVCEPRRLWKRYLKHNPRFVALMAAQLTHLRSFD